ncbi:MAG: response regulator transcription factor [Lachnospiraceae bacterium]|nr:response regulator transcription factor [Lachnospiraceae bacterium]
MIRIAICDDDELACTIIEEYTTEVCKSFGIEIECDIYNGGYSLIKHIDRGEEYHLIFLDIEMNPVSGIGVGDYIRNKICNDSVQIVYVSGKNGYDRQLFEFRPFDFISKPINKSAITKTIKKYQRVYGSRNNVFRYRYGHDSYWVNAERIMYFKSRDRKMIIKTVDSEDVFYGRLEDVKAQLGDCGFLAPHKTYLVNYRYIKMFEPDRITLTNGETIPIAKGRRTDIAKLRITLENGF